MSIARHLPRARAPIGLAAFLALPLFFGSLMATSLAIEKPRVVEWRHTNGHLVQVFHQPTASNEWHIWLLALVPPLVLVLAGLVASYLPFAIYVTCVVAIVEAVLLSQRLHRWQVHHTARFPHGEDLIADNTTSNLISRGEWEHDAAQTVRSFQHYTIALAIAAALITAALTLRRRRGGAAPAVGNIAELETGGAPGITG